MTEQTQAIATLLSLVNPAICAALFAKATEGEPLSAKMTDATKAGLAILVILAVAALVGIRLLNVFGVSLDAFMVEGRCSGVDGVLHAGRESASTDATGTKYLTPLILFAASPGTTTGVITISAAHTRLASPG